MSDATRLETGYRRCPRTFRGEHEAELLEVLMAGARQGQVRPTLMERLDLMRGPVRMRLRPTISRSDRSSFAAVKLMCVGAAVELATAGVIVATLPDVKAAILTRDRGYSQAQWHAEVAGSLKPIVVWAGIAAGFWLWMAWASGRGHRWARIVFAVFFGTTTYSLIHGLAGGSAVYARADLAIGIVLWLVQFAVLVLLLHKHWPIGEVRTWGRNRVGLH